MAHITSITYQELLPTASYLNVRIGVEYSLEKYENPQQALLAAKQLVKEFHREQWPQLYIDEVPDKPMKIVEQGEEQQRPKDIENGIIHDIKTCNDLKVLETYRLLLPRYPKAQEAYDNQLKKLQNV